MSADDYWDDLLLALKAADIAGREIGETVSELAAHIEDIGADPYTEFGDPSDLVNSLVGRSGTTRTTVWRLRVFLVAVQCVVLSMIALVWADAGVHLSSISLAALVAGSSAVLLNTWWFSTLLQLASSPSTQDNRRSLRLRLGLGLAAMGVVPALAFGLLPDTEAVATSDDMWWLMLVVAGGLVGAELALSAHHGRLVFSPDSPPMALQAANRFSGSEAIRTGLRVAERRCSRPLV